MPSRSSSPLSDTTAIAGIGATEFSKDAGRSELRLAADAIHAALTDAGLDAKQLDGLVCFDSDVASPIPVANALALPNIRYWATTSYGGGGACATALLGMMAVATGQANYVACYRSLRTASGRRFGSWSGKEGSAGLEQFFAPFGIVTPVHRRALAVTRYMHDFNIRPEHFGAVAVACRKHANRNPKAVMYNRTLTMDEYLGSRIICEPLRLFDCCLETDGAVAFIVTTAERAKDLKQRPAYILAAAQGAGRQPVWPPPTALHRTPMTTTHEAAASAKNLYAIAGVEPKDIDCAQLYDHFTPLVLMALEAYGFCGVGEGGTFAEGGRIELGGQLPINTAGGNLSEGYIHGVQLIPEAVRQMRGTSTAQVQDAELTLVCGAADDPSSALILRR